MFDLLVRGGPVMVPLGLCSVLAVGILAERLWYLHRVARDTSALLKRVESTASKGGQTVAALNASKVPLARIVQKALERGETPSLSAAERQGAEEARRLEGHLPTVEAIVTLAPLLGLLGTITGMIRSFHILGVQGGDNPFAVTGGIAEALITTATGLIVAVCAFSGYVWCQHIMEREVHRMETVAGDILEQLGS